jgi:hypothetical protein
MSQLNLKQILSGDTISTVVDKINYNFDQIVLNGGGPRGLQGLIGPPGLIGKQGIVGGTGPSGPDGTYLYASGASPGVYPFGTGGENLPRINDVFLEGGPSFINIWSAITGASGIEWNLESTVTAPGGGLSKIVYDSVATTPAFTSFANDPNVGGEFLIGSPDALTSPVVIDSAYDINSPAPKKVPELSTPYSFSDSTLTVVSAQNQLRLLNFDPYFMDPSNVLIEGGGVVHSLASYVGPTGSTVQIYNVQSGDTYGRKYLTINFNSETVAVGNAPILLHATPQNKMIIGGGEFDATPARLSVNESIAIGRRATNFYQGASYTQFTNSSVVATVGAVIEGNIAIGKNNNRLATAGFYSLDASTSLGRTNVVIDTENTGNTARYSELQIGDNIYANFINSAIGLNWWRFRHIAAANNTLNFSGFSTLQGNVIAPTMYFSLTSTGAGQVKPRIGINNTNPVALLEVGSAPQRVAMGDIDSFAGGNEAAYLGFNLYKTYTGNWQRRAGAIGNAGRTFWANSLNGLGLSLFRSSGTSLVTTLTDNDVYAATRVYLNPSGWLAISPTGNAALTTIQGYPVVFNFGSNGTTPGSTAGDVLTEDLNGSTLFRRFIAVFGTGFQNDTEGSPLIAATQGLTPSATGLTMSIFPQYTFHGNTNFGVYLAGGTTANDMTGVEIGLAVGGTAGITVVGGYSSTITRPRLGVNNRDPLSRAHFGSLITVEEGTRNYLGYNLYYSNDDAEDRRIFGSSTQANARRGFAAYSFTEQLYGSNDILNAGGILQLKVGVPGTVSSSTGGTSSQMIGSTGTVAYVEISPPLSQLNAAGNLWNITGLAGTGVFSSAPQVRIGVKKTGTYGQYNQPFEVRGTLQVAPQRVVGRRGQVSAQVFDDYNLMFTNRFSEPIMGIAADSTTVGQLGSERVQSVAFRFQQLYTNIGYTTVTSDPTFLTVSSRTDETDLRTAIFGGNFRVGVGGTASTDAGLFAQPTGGATKAAIFSGDTVTTGVSEVNGDLLVQPGSGGNNPVVQINQTSRFKRYYAGRFDVAYNIDALNFGVTSFDMYAPGFQYSIGVMNGNPITPGYITLRLPPDAYLNVPTGLSQIDANKVIINASLDANLGFATGKITWVSTAFVQPTLQNPFGAVQFYFCVVPFISNGGGITVTNNNAKDGVGNFRVYFTITELE